MENKVFISLAMVLLCIFYIRGENMPIVNIPSAKYFFEDKKIQDLINYVKLRNDKKIKELVDSGVEISYIGKDGISPLYYFFLKKDYNSFKKMLELGADPNVNPPKIWRLIDSSMTYKDDRYFKLLLEYNVDINYIPEYGEPLLKSSLHGNADIKYLKLLLEQGINLKIFRISTQ
jgi:ankyrin repeat protein